MAAAIPLAPSAKAHLLPPPLSKPVSSYASSSDIPGTGIAVRLGETSPGGGKSRRRILEAAAAGLGFLTLPFVAVVPEADATRIEYYATVADKPCDMSFANSGLGYCDVAVGTGVKAPRGQLINVHYTARFADGTVFDSSYKRGRPLTMRIGVGKVLPGLDQGISGGGGVSPMHVGGKRKLMIPPMLAYGPEPAGCFSGDCNIPGNATLLYDIFFVGIYK